jgi:hypothetical protein
MLWDSCAVEGEESPRNMFGVELEALKGRK